jgi:L-asparagine transporter-like permease
MTSSKKVVNFQSAKRVFRFVLHSSSNVLVVSYAPLVAISLISFLQQTHKQNERRPRFDHGDDGSSQQTTGSFEASSRL